MKRSGRDIPKGFERAALFVLLAAACSAAGCIRGRAVYIEDEKKTAERTAEQIHARLNAGQYGAVYDDAADYFKAMFPDRAGMLADMKASHELTGRILRVKQHWTNYVKGDPVPVRSVYIIECEKGDFTEWMAFVITSDGKNARLSRYQTFNGSIPAPDEYARPTNGN